MAGGKRKDGVLCTAGGRVLGVTATGDSLKAAVDKAYGLAAHIRFEGAYYRSDIGRKALQAEREG